MKTILVPTDFSPTAKNATMYALELAKQMGAEKIVLYHTYQAPISVDPMVPTIELLDLESLKTASEKALQDFRLQVKVFVPENMVLDTVSEYNLLTEGLDDVCSRTGAALIVMGITGGNALEENLFGSNTISVAKHTKVPVIIVPADAGFTRIEEVVLACDFKHVAETTPVEAIRQLLDTTGAKLFVLNIDHNNNDYTPDTPLESHTLDTLLEGHDPEYYFIDSTDFTEAINTFAVEKGVDLIITIPKKHGWFEGLFQKSHTKKLAFHSHVPLMVVHEAK